MRGLVWLVLVLGLVACSTADQMPTLTPTEEPFYAPDFTLTALDGTSYTLRALQGKWVLVNFWATWCEPCLAEMPILEEVARLYADQLQLLGVNMHETAEEVQPFLTDLDISYPILLNPDDATLVNYQVVGLPQTVLIDPNGEIQWRQLGAIVRQDFLQELENRLGTTPQ